MTEHQIRQRICGSAGMLTLPTAKIKERLSQPDGIQILARWCPRTARDVLVLTYQTDEGRVHVRGAVGFLNGHETIFDGWIIIIDRANDAAQIHGKPADDTEDRRAGHADRAGHRGAPGASTATDDDGPTLFDGLT